MFMGEYHHNLDSKGRLIIPAKFRDEIGEKMVFTRGMEGCIFGYPIEEWQKIEAKLAKLLSRPSSTISATTSHKYE